MPGETTQNDDSAVLLTGAPAPEPDVRVDAGGTAPTPVATGRYERWIRPAVVVVLLASVALRFIAPSPLWLDEAQTVSIAHRSLPHLFSALREDGSPPLYYLLLHYWMAAFGTGDFAVRSLSGIFSVLSLPVMYVVARRFKVVGDTGWPALLLLATCPFVVRYASETRMYSLLLLLVLLAMLTYEAVWRTGGWGANIAAAVVTACLVLTQYWSFFLLATFVVAVAVAAWRGQRRALRLLVPMVVGCLAFIPWFPSFAYQNAHTGAPWGSPPGFEVPLLTLGAWVGDGLTAPFLRWCYYLLAAIALIGYATTTGRLSFGRPVRRWPLLVLGFGVVVMAVGVIASNLTNTSYSPRYSAIAVAPILLVVAAGIAALPINYRTPVLAIVVALSLASAALIPGQLRTQAGQVATILKAANPHDLVVFCPDQLGPAVNRLAPHEGTQVVYPTFGSAAMVDWVNYAHRNETANPIAFARTALKRAAGHRVWLIYQEGYNTLAGGCSSLLSSFTAARGVPNQALLPHGAFEKYAVDEFPVK